MVKRRRLSSEESYEPSNLSTSSDEGGDQEYVPDATTVVSDSDQGYSDVEWGGNGTAKVAPASTSGVKSSPASKSKSGSEGRVKAEASTPTSSPKRSPSKKPSPSIGSTVKASPKTTPRKREDDVEGGKAAIKPWTREEEQIIWGTFLEHKPNWEKIMKAFEAHAKAREERPRTRQSVVTHFERYMKKPLLAASPGKSAAHSH
ncbi:unnamed protein product [Parajaminaea phylloscopi]